MPQLFVAAAAAIGVSTAAIVTIGATAISWATIVGYAAYAAVTAYSLNALNKKAMSKAAASTSAASYGTSVNAVSAAADHAIIYGQHRVGGVVFYRSVSSDQKFLHTLIALAGHECEEIGTVYANDIALTLNGRGFATNPEFQIKDDNGNFSSYAIRVKKFTGGPSQIAAIDLVNEDPLWTRSHKASGITYIYVRAEYDQSAFPTGFPVFSAVVKGKKVYDPRTGSTAWSDNAALCLRDYMVSDYGLGVESSELDDTAFSTAANICDENVSLAAGGTEDRYTTNGSFTTALNPQSAITELLASLAGTIWYSQGKWGIAAGAYTTPVTTLDEDDLRSALQIRTRHSRRDNFNTVTGTFSGPATNYQATDYPQVTSSTFVTADGGETVSQDISLPFASTASRAQRLAKIALFRNREQLTVSATFGLNALQLKIGDIVNITNERLGFSVKPFEVVDWRFGFGDDMTLSITMTLREISSGVFSWSAEEAAFESNNTILPDPYLTAPAGVSLSSELRIVNEAAVGVLMIDVTASQVYADKFEVEYKKSSDSTYVRVGRQTGGRFEVIGVEDGQYDIRVRTLNSFGVKSAWTSRDNFDVTVFAPPPADVTGFTGNVVGNTLHLTWEPVADLDLSHYKIRYNGVTSGAVYSESVDLVEKVARPANSVTVPAQTGTYFIRAVDKVGGLSDNATSFVVLIDPNNVEDYDAVATLTEHTAFAGDYTNTIKVTDPGGDYVRLDTGLFDDQAGLFDDALGFFDGGTGLLANGYYTFSNVLDLGEKYTSRVRPSLTVGFIDLVNDFDSAKGNFDDRNGLFDGEPEKFDTTSARFELRHTDDDPNTADPDWTDWQPFIVDDVSARGMQFRVKLISHTGEATPSLTQASVQIDMPERVEADSDISFTGIKNVTYPTGFKDVPALGVALANLADGERYVITNKSRTGFTIQILDGATQSTNTSTLDYVAKGYGKELV